MLADTGGRSEEACVGIVFARSPRKHRLLCSSSIASQLRFILQVLREGLAIFPSETFLKGYRVAVQRSDATLDADRLGS